MRNKEYPYYSVAQPVDLRGLIEHCEQYGDKTAFWYKNRFGEVRVSYRQFCADITRLGTYLHSIGLQNKHITILGENSYEWIISYFAIVNGGNVVVPLDKESSAQDITKLLLRSDCSTVIHSDTYSDEAKASGLSCLCMRDFPQCLEAGQRLLDEGDDSFTSYSINPDAMCAIVFTSGTTSDPKGVMLSQRNLIRDAIVSSQNLLIPDGAVMVLPLYHTFGFMACIICQILRGHSVYINSSLRRLLSDIQYAKPRHIAVVPMLLGVIYDKVWENIRASGKEAMFNRMISVSNFLLKHRIDLRKRFFKKVLAAFGGNLEMIICGGSAIGEQYIEGFRSIGITVTNGYGITECSPIVSTMRNRHYSPSSVGAIQPEIDVRIVDGEIQVKGQTVFSGYYKDEESTSAVFDGDWFKTGDMGYIDEDGLLYITGRTKNLIILSNGKNVSPEEIENILTQSIPEISEVIVRGENDQIVAEIFPCENNPGVQSLIRNAVLEICRSLPQYKQIAKVYFRDCEFPKTSTKKIRRSDAKENCND